MNEPGGDDAVDGTATASDRRALDDLQAGRLIDSDAVATRLGGWQAARIDPAMPVPAFRNRSEAADIADCGDATLLQWTASAVADCDRLRTILAAIGGDAHERFAAILVAAMVRLMVDGAGDPGAIAEIAICPSLTLRTLVRTDAIVVLSLRPSGAIT